MTQQTASGDQRTRATTRCKTFSLEKARESDQVFAPNRDDGPNLRSVHEVRKSHQIATVRFQRSGREPSLDPQPGEELGDGSGKSRNGRHEEAP